MTIEAPPRPPHPDEAEALIEEARRRARRRRYGALVVLALLGAVLYLVIGHGGGGGSASRAGSSPGGSGSAQRSPTSSSSPGVTSCVLARTTGDFDGDGARDVATLVDVVPTARTCKHALTFARPHLHLRVAFGSGGEVDQRLTHCGYGPCPDDPGRLFTSTDLDGDGRSELALEVGPGAAIDNVEFFRVARHAIHPLRIAPEGTARADLKPGPAVLGGGFDSAQFSPVACMVRPNGSRVLVSVHAFLVGNSIGGAWRVHRAELELRGNTLRVVWASTTTTHGVHVRGFHFHGYGSQFQVACS